MTKKENLLKGIWKENPLLVSLLGMCPSLGITTKLENALGMGIAVLFVLVMSNLIISLIKKIVPNEIRIAVYIVVIATLVTIVDMVMGAFLPELHASLGLFIPLIVVNCIILGRAEAFASKNGPLDSVLDGIGMALGYTLALSIVSIAREFLGTGAITVWGSLVITIAEGHFFTSFFTFSAGACIVLGLTLVIIIGLKNICASRKTKKEEVAK